MRIVTWNCNGAFRRKICHIDVLDADVLVIQECEDPSASTSEYKAWAENYLWAGSGKNKGIGIFRKNGGSVEPLSWNDGGFQQFLPARIDGHLDILAVWTRQVAASNFRYIGQFWKYLQLHKAALNANVVICGDFNSNQIWDKRGRIWNHTECVKELEANQFGSLYHLATNELQGQESRPTFFLHRNLLKPYHIDYAFAHFDRIPNDWDGITVGEPSVWLQHSDHMPVIIDL